MSENTSLNDLNFKLDFNSRVQNTIINTHKRPKSVTKNSARSGYDKQLDVGLDNKRKLREYDILVRKLHEANSAMNIMEKTLKEFMESEDNKTKDITF